MIKLTIPLAGKPIQDKRIYKRKNGQQFIGNSSKSNSYKKHLEFVIDMQMKRQTLIEGLVKVEIVFIYRLPKSRRKHEREIVANGGMIRKGTASDLDNLLKALQDAMSGKCYTDDRKIAVLHAEKYYGKEDEIRVDITKLED